MKRSLSGREGLRVGRAWPQDPRRSLPGVFIRQREDGHGKCGEGESRDVKGERGAHDALGGHRRRWALP